ncbi:MAG: carboxypeptidase-like regulatory domain-containing protein, partial [candidate division WOR-3 bacterium]
MSGAFRYRDLEEGPFKPVRGARVFLYDYDGGTNYQYLGFLTYTDNNGQFTFNNVPNLEEDGTHQDLVFRIETYNSVFGTIHYNPAQGDTTYKYQTMVINNIPNGNQNVGTFDVAPDNIQGAAFHIFDVIKNGYDWAQSKNWENLTGVICYWWPENNASAYGFDGVFNHIKIAGTGLFIPPPPNPPYRPYDEFDDGIISHEYGHFLSKIANMDNSPAGPHVWWQQCQNDGRLAWGEGLAHFLSCVINGTCNILDRDYLENWQSRWTNYNHENCVATFSWQPSQNANELGELCEASVAGTIWDIHDNHDDDQNNDGHGDFLSVGFNPVYLTLKTTTPGTNHRPWTVIDFYNSWMARGGDFEEQIRNIYFEHGIQINQPPQQNQNVNNPEFRIVPEDDGVQPREGPTMFKISGTDASSTANSYVWWRYCDLNFPITSGTVLSFWLYNKTSPGNYGHFSIDGITADGYTLKDWSSGGYIVDQYGVRIHPAIHSSPPGEWRQYNFSLAPMQGKTLRSLSIGYDDGNNSETGDFIAYFDGIK